MPLLTLGDVHPDEVPLWVNAANAVLVPSEREGFGLAVLEALACDVPVLATPVGIAPLALDGIAGAHCGPFDAAAWRAALARASRRQPIPRVAGRARAELLSARPDGGAGARRLAGDRVGRPAGRAGAAGILAAEAPSVQGSAASPDR